MPAGKNPNEVARETCPVCGRKDCIIVREPDGAEVWGVHPDIRPGTRPYTPCPQCGKPYHTAEHKPTHHHKPTHTPQAADPSPKAGAQAPKDNDGAIPPAPTAGKKE